ncbi:MAG TPA: CD225/dispanin family protein [Fimbriimonas sp.]|nr:CD225/dispanin family protein [Fimbriimonas sp.]
MNPTYVFIASDGNRYGPSSLEELNQWFMEGRITDESELEEMPSGRRVTYGQLSRPAGPPPGSVYETPPSTAAYPRQFAPSAPIPNHLAKAIVSTVCIGCLPLGIMAIVQSAQVNGLAASGQYERAQEASRKADTWSNWSIGIGVVILVLEIVLRVVAGGSGKGF